MDILIQAHPSRAHLLPRIQAELPTAKVVWDPEPDGPRHPWRAYAACLAHVTEGPALVIQDDAVPAEGLSELLGSIPSKAPGRLILLHVNQHPRALAQLVTLAASKGQRVVGVRPMPWLPVVANIWPADLAADCLAWAATRPDKIQDRQRSDDSVVGAWMQRRRLVAAALAPSVVEHPDDVPSLMQSHPTPKPRTAAIFCGDVRGWRWAG